MALSVADIPDICRVHDTWMPLIVAPAGMVKPKLVASSQFVEPPNNVAVAALEFVVTLLGLVQAVEPMPVAFAPVPGPSGPWLAMSYLVMVPENTPVQHPAPGTLIN